MPKWAIIFFFCTTKLSPAQLRHVWRSATIFGVNRYRPDTLFRMFSLFIFSCRFTVSTNTKPQQDYDRYNSMLNRSGVKLTLWSYVVIYSTILVYIIYQYVGVNISNVRVLKDILIDMPAPSIFALYSIVHSHSHTHIYLPIQH